MDTVEAERIERALKLELMKVDIQLKTKQAFWETPRNLAILLGTVATLTALISGYLGYKAGSTPPAPPQPIVIQMVPAPTPAPERPTVTQQGPK